MKGIEGKRFSLKNRKNYPKNYFRKINKGKFDKKVSYIDKIAKIIKKKIFSHCLICQLFFLKWENFISKEHENFHVLSHPMEFIAPKFFPISSLDWCVEEEKIFYRAIQVFGISNWNIISLFLETKTPSECENHFFKTSGEMGIKNQKKNWRIFSSHLHYFEKLEEWQDFLPVCNIKVEKKESLFPQRCEISNELEENFEDLLNEKVLSSNFIKKVAGMESPQVLSFYNQQLFYREKRKKNLIRSNYKIPDSTLNFSSDDSFNYMLKKIDYFISDNVSSNFFKKKQNIHFKKETFFRLWIFDFEIKKKFIEREIFFPYCNSLGGKYFQLKTGYSPIFSNENIINQNFRNVLIHQNLLSKSENFSFSFIGMGFHGVSTFKKLIILPFHTNLLLFFKRYPLKTILGIAFFFNKYEYFLFDIRKKIINNIRFKRNSRIQQN